MPGFQPLGRPRPALGWEPGAGAGDEPGAGNKVGIGVAGAGVLMNCLGRGTGVGAATRATVDTATGAAAGPAASVDALGKGFGRGTGVRIEEVVADVVVVDVVMSGLGRGTGVSFFAREAKLGVACRDDTEASAAL